LVQTRRLSQADGFGRNLRPQSRQQSGCSETSGPDRNSMFGRPESNRHGQSTIPIIAGVDCRPRAKPLHTNEVANRVFSGFSDSAPTLQSIMRCSFLGNVQQSTTAVCTENLNPDVVVMKSAKDRV
jgi:hypothetical protein